MESPKLGGTYLSSSGVHSLLNPLVAKLSVFAPNVWGLEALVTASVQEEMIHLLFPHS